MPRLLALTGVVLIALVGAGTAQALSEPASTQLRAVDANDIKAFIRSPDFVGNPALNTDPPVQKGITRMQVAANLRPALRTLGTIALAATAFEVGWRIGSIPGSYIYNKLTGDLGTTSGLGGASSWKWSVAGAGSSTFHSVYTAPADGWYLQAASYGGEVALDSNPAVFAAWGTAIEVSASPLRYAWTRTQAEMEEDVLRLPIDSTTYAGLTAATPSTFDPPGTTTDPELEAALDAIDPAPGTPGTAIEEETAVALLDELDPGWDIGVLLQPLPNETYTQYITRLQEAGWVGDATTTVLATETPGYGPDAVVRVIATPVGGTTTVYDPLGWPGTSPNIAIDSDITIRYNPDTAPEAPTTATPTPITGAPTTIPGAPALDFTPVTDIDFGCKFPYGFVCYAVDFTEQFNVAGDAPSFTFDFPTVSVSGNDYGGGGDYTVDLNVMDDYMALWRGILTVVLWVGAIYLVATRMLGFRAGGDPGEAIDDVL